MSTFVRRSLLLLCLALAPSVAVRAETRQEMARRIFATLHPMTGSIRIDAAHLSVDLPSGYGLLSAADTRTLFTDLYGNPPEDSDDTLGAILPMDVLPGTPERSFEVVIRARHGRIAEDGPGADLDPTKIDQAYRAFNEEMAQQRAAAGAPVLTHQTIIEPARYDRARHQLTVARAFRWGDEDFLSVHVVTDVLTRDGMVQFLATSSLVTLPLIKSEMAALLPTVRFDSGYRYEDGAGLPTGKLELRMMAIGMSVDE